MKINKKKKKEGKNSIMELSGRISMEGPCLNASDAIDANPLSGTSHITSPLYLSYVSFNFYFILIFSLSKWVRERERERERDRERERQRERERETDRQTDTDRERCKTDGNDSGLQRH